MDIDEIKVLMEAMAASDLSEMQVAKEGWTLRLTRAAGQVGTAQAATAPAGKAVAAAPAAPRSGEPAAPAADRTVRSPLSGVVHFRPSPDAPPFVETGRAVSAGEVLCLVEAMKMFNEIRAERAGTVEAILVSPGEDVDAGQPLLTLA
ncbi:acetyl-CoA carboxylase biotin carboxyl carrier protein [Antarcticirhabdus aurantiaca]|uniref:Acetyl-CoA carboxylase biotin carboxyl carrier protein n=1 Tax=Antarcticirhabdus aurantiaca TaxID=2606717 RepID=A0ACD4NT51_9HYPH|nr:acetyl-CoA carboxylase biotin carboxyl carrier protein [Antarcticirhabdus aurantiaca]WAJ29938.1 acetyl-CoA carboxylase biotin carboxyl carrier protein [Jeongeuplla avenae]